jgi:protein SCO1/2
MLRCLAVLKFVLVAMAAMVAMHASASAQGTRWGRDYLPNVPVQTHDGKTVLFYDDMLKGKIAVISLIYTSCRDICPLVTARLSQLEEKLGSQVGKDVFFVSISVDPVTDTPSVLKDYAETFQAGPGWTFLTGKPSDISAIRRKLGDRSARIGDHRNEILLYNDTTGEWERNSIFGDINVLATAVRAMDPASRNQPNKPVGVKSEVTTARAIPNASPAPSGSQVELPGQSLFVKLCSGCHTVGRGDKVGPDLLELSNRRSRDWLTRFIGNPDQVRKEGDPVARALAEKFNTVRMPNLALSEHDVGDVIAYVDAMTYAAKADQRSAKVGQGHHAHHGHKH